jgi:CheY-like chemotaxis protein
VLLAEDNGVDQIVTRGLLTRLGCAGDVAAMGEEALRLLDRAQYDLLLNGLHDGRTEPV